MKKQKQKTTSTETHSAQHPVRDGRSPGGGPRPTPRGFFSINGMVMQGRMSREEIQEFHN